MASIKSGEFKGFFPRTFEFLMELSIYNSKEWFAANRKNYESYVLNPLVELVKDLGPFMLTIDPDFDIRPAVDKTIARIYRDIRFSKDKSPYRSNIWITFKRLSQDWKEDPCYFFEIFPDWYRFGMGFYSASKPAMDSMREFIEVKPEEFRDITSSYKGRIDFAVEGDKYKKIINKDIPGDLQNWYQRKDLYLVCNRKNDELLLSGELVNELKEGFRQLALLYQFLWRLK